MVIRQCGGKLGIFGQLQPADYGRLSAIVALRAGRRAAHEKSPIDSGLRLKHN
jgi:hypothetical protein